MYYTHYENKALRNKVVKALNSKVAGMHFSAKDTTVGIDGKAYKVYRIDSSARLTKSQTAAAQSVCVEVFKKFYNLKF